MRTTGMKLNLNMQAAHSRDKAAASEARQKGDDVSLNMNKEKLRLRHESGDLTGDNECEKGVVSGGSAVALGVAGVLAVAIPGPGTIAGAIIAAVVGVIAIIEAIRAEGKSEDINDLNKKAGDAELAADTAKSSVKSIDERIKRESEDVQTHTQQVFDNLRREYDANHNPS